jgi:hypothetical protein
MALGRVLCRGKYALAAPLYERAMKIREKTLGPENPEFASSVNSLAILYRHQVRTCRANATFAITQG